MRAKTSYVEGISIDSLTRAASADELWGRRFTKWSVDGLLVRLHLAVFTEPFLTYLLNGCKTVESRFSRNRIAPYDQVSTGDVILIKAVSGPVVGVCEAERAWFYELNSDVLQQIQQQFGSLICASEDFWDARQDRSYATLITLKNVRPLQPFAIKKRDRRGWVIVKAQTAIPPTIIALAGRIQAGKTTVAKTLSATLHSKRASFGDYFRIMAQRAGIDPTDRAKLQELGASVVAASPVSLCEDLLRSVKWHPGETLIIDGIRHLEILNILRRLVAPMRLVLVYVRRDAARLSSLHQSSDEESLTVFEKHSTEIQNDVLCAMSDITVSGEAKVDQIVEGLLRLIGDLPKR